MAYAATSAYLRRQKDLLKACRDLVAELKSHRANNTHLGDVPLSELIDHLEEKIKAREAFIAKIEAD